MVRPVFIPRSTGMAPLTGAQLADQLRSQPEETIIPGTEAARSAISEAVPNPVSVPPMQTEGLPGVLAEQPLTEDSSVEDLARSTQSPFASRERMQVMYDDQGNPVIDPATGTYKYVPVTMEDYANERQRQMESLGSLNLDMIGENPINTANSLMLDKALSSTDVAARYRKGLADPNVSAEDIAKWSEEEGNALGILAGRAETSFGNDAFIRSNEAEYMGQPAAAVELAKLGLYDPEHVRLFSTLTGAATALTVGQLTMFKKDDSVVPISQDGRQMDDARPLVDVVNSTAASLRGALERMGYNLPMDSIRKIANAHVLQQMEDRNLIPNKDKKGRQVVSASPEMKTLARTMAYTAEALAGDRKRNMPTRTPQISGSDFRNPGSQTTANSKLETEHPAADLVKDMMGSVGYVYKPKDVSYKTIELQDILDNAEKDEAGKIKWSTSVFAKRNGVSEADYKVLLGKAKPKDAYNKESEADVVEFKLQQHNHAVDTINNKIEALKYDIQNANNLKGVFYIGHIHSTANQRFFENSAGADAMSSKTGVREMRQPAEQDLVRPADLFGSNVDRIKAKGLDALLLKGRARQKAFENMHPSDLAAISVMMAAVVNYYTVAADPSIQDKTITKQSEATQLAKYNVEIGNRLAELGREYNAFLEDPKGDNYDNIKSYLGGMPKGEALGNKNLWDDMAQLRGRSLGAARDLPMQMSYLNFDDGNQNGIFLQSLFFGESMNAKRLGSFNPRLGDMREYATRVISSNIESMFYDNPEKINAWRSFFTAASKNEKFSSDLFKKPLMQNSYSKDAGVFGDEVDAFLSEPFYNTAALETLVNSGVYPSVSQASEELNLALEATLREIVNQNYAQVLMSVGRYSAVLGQGLSVENIDGDTMHLAPVGLLPIKDHSKDEEGISRDDGHIIKEIGLKTDDFLTKSGDKVSVPIATRREDPNFSKGTIRYWNKTKKQFDEFNNYTGSALSRHFVVMPIQAADGGLVKLTMLAVNKNRKTTAPASFVHDAINATGSAALLYRNAYNNIAIPQAIEEIAKFGHKLRDSIKKAEDNMRKEVSQMSSVGIGEDGDYPSLGGLFDENFEKFKEDGSYKPRYLEKRIAKNLASGIVKTRQAAEQEAKQAWEKRKKPIYDILKEAQALGWRPPGSIDERQRMNLAVRPDNFLKMVGLAADLLAVHGPSSNFTAFVNNFSSNVMRTKNDLLKDSLVKAAGIGQMSVSGGGSRVKVTKKDIPKKVPFSIGEEKPPF